MAESEQEAALERMVDEHAAYLFRFAAQRVDDRESIEDLIQETFLAAVRGFKKFRGDSAERTWLTGILKHKIIDFYRGRSRNREMFQDLPDPGELENHLHERRHWDDEIGPRSWSADPAALAQSREFHDIMRRCLENMPQRMAQVFRMRILDELPSPQLCEVFNCTPENLRMILHRARFQLRKCLELNWFGNDS